MEVKSKCFYFWGGFAIAQRLKWHNAFKIIYLDNLDAQEGLWEL